MKGKLVKVEKEEIKEVGKVITLHFDIGNGKIHKRMGKENEKWYPKGIENYIGLNLKF